MAFVRQAIDQGSPAPDLWRWRTPVAPRTGVDPIRIGLINNMPDAALAATERQFTGLLAAAAGSMALELQLFSLPEIARSDRVRAFMGDRYRPIDGLADAGIDALIVTGAEPTTPDLTGEAFWPSLAWVIDWARDGVVSSLWSCLAAHAAGLRLDGVRRRPQARKLSGVFACGSVGRSPLLAGSPASRLVPHSRYNGLAEADLEARGYRILTRSERAGVDMFVKQDGGLFVFLQGHPEYEADSLLREYRRDVARFLGGLQPRPPAPPIGQFDLATEAALADLTVTAIGERRPELMPRFEALLAADNPKHSWRGPAVALCRAWLNDVAEAKTGQPGVRKAQAVSH